MYSCVQFLCGQTVVDKTNLGRFLCCEQLAGEKALLGQSKAYALRPEQSGSVLAAAHLFTPLGLALPWLVGSVADHAGTTVALVLLVAQPLGLLLLVAASRTRPRATTCPPRA